MSNRSYFQFYETFEQMIELLPDDEQLKFYKATVHYGLFQEEPLFEGKDQVIFIAIKNAIDLQIQKRAILTENGSKNKKSKEEVCLSNESKNKSCLSEKSKEEVCFFDESKEDFCSSEMKWNEMNRNELKRNELKRNEEKRNESEEAIPSLASKEYAQKIFDKWNAAGLPCWNGNFVTFFTKDFKDTIQLRNGIHSNDVLSAVDNYINELNAADSYITGKMTFQSFVESRLFKQMLPYHYDHSNFVKFDKKEEQKTPVERAEAFREMMKKNKDFDEKLFDRHVSNWSHGGEPKGVDFLKWQEQMRQEEIEHPEEYEDLE